MTVYMQLTKANMATTFCNQLLLILLCILQDVRNTYYKYVRIYPTLQNFTTKNFHKSLAMGRQKFSQKKISQMSLPGERVVLEYQLQNRVENLADDRASGRNVGMVFNPVLKLVFENYPFSCLSQLRSPHFIRTCVNAMEVAPRS